MLIYSCFLLAFGVTHVDAFGTNTDTSATEQLELQQDKPAFSYQMENRPDPFVPFITEKAATSKVNMDEIVENNEPLTGMQLFEPGQLTLVAVLTADNTNYAMVQDVSGKGYVINEGMKIGVRGVVKTIKTNTVQIEETAVTRAGKKIITDVVMLLRKEGEE